MTALKNTTFTCTRSKFIEADKSFDIIIFVKLATCANLKDTLAGCLSWENRIRIIPTFIKLSTTMGKFTTYLGKLNSMRNAIFDF